MVVSPHLVVFTIFSLMLHVSGEFMMNDPQPNTEQSTDPDSIATEVVISSTETYNHVLDNHTSTIDAANIKNASTDGMVDTKENYKMVNWTKPDESAIDEYSSMNETKSGQNEYSDEIKNLELLGETSSESSFEKIPPFLFRKPEPIGENKSDTKYETESGYSSSAVDLGGYESESTEPPVVVITPVTSVNVNYSFPSTTSVDKNLENHTTTTLPTWEEKTTSGSLIADLLARKVRTIASPTKLSDMQSGEFATEVTTKYDRDQSNTIQKPKHDSDQGETGAEPGLDIPNMTTTDKSPINPASSIEVRENGQSVMIQAIVKPENVTNTKPDTTEQRNKQEFMNETNAGSEDQVDKKQPDIDSKKSEPLRLVKDSSGIEMPQRQLEPINITCREANETDITQPRNLTILLDDKEGLLVTWLQPLCLETFTSYYVTIIKGKSGDNILYYTEVPCTTELCRHTIPRDNITAESDQNVFVVGRWEHAIGKASSVVLALYNDMNTQHHRQEQLETHTESEIEAEYTSKMSTLTAIQTPESSTEKRIITRVDNNSVRTMDVDKTTETQVRMTESSVATTTIYIEPKSDTPESTRKNKEPLCTEAGNSNATRVQHLSVQDNVNSVLLSWDKPECIGTVISYEVTALKAIIVNASMSKDYVKTVKCQTTKCMLEINTTTCHSCFARPRSYSFKVSAIIDYVVEHTAQIIESRIDIRGCTEFKTPQHAVRTCTGGSKVVRFTNGRSETVWGKNAYCQVHCNKGYGFYRSVSSFYTCQPEVGWHPQTKAPDCLPTTSIAKATLQYKLIYDRNSISDLEGQFTALVERYAASLCQHSVPNCTVTKVYSERHKPSQTNNDTTMQQKTDVTLTIEPPVRHIADQNDMIAQLERNLATQHNDDNRFMTLLDWSQLKFVLPMAQEIPGGQVKARAVICCHECPIGYQYRHKSCVRCPAGEQCHIPDLNSVDATNSTDAPAQSVSEQPVEVVHVNDDNIGETVERHNSSSIQ